MIDIKNLLAIFFSVPGKFLQSADQKQEKLLNREPDFHVCNNNNQVSFHSNDECREMVVVVAAARRDKRVTSFNADFMALDNSNSFLLSSSLRENLEEIFIAIKFSRITVINNA
jgi:hypothetical protein